MESSTDKSEALKLVIFRLLSEEFAAPIAGVSEILRPQRLTRMPRAPHYVMGVMNLRGRVFPVLDLKRRLGMATAPQDAKSRVMVVENSGDQLGLLVDEVKEVYRAPESALEEVPEMTQTVTRDYLHGVVAQDGRMILVLDLASLLRPLEAVGAEA
jgi:purine-binding chemotaxis protein CheW